MGRRARPSRPSPAAPRARSPARQLGLRQRHQLRQQLRATAPATAPGNDSGSTSSSTKTVTGSVAQTQWGPVQVQLTVAQRVDHQGEHPAVPERQRPRRRDRQLLLADPDPGDALEPEREHRHGQRRDVHQHRLHPVPAERARPGQPVTVTSPPRQRYVAQLMGMPVSLALRGRHTDDEAAREAWERCVAELTEVDRVFSTYREDSVVSRLARGEIDLADCPAEVHEVLDARRAGAGGVRRRLRRTPRPGRTACRSSTPAGS